MASTLSKSFWAQRWVPFASHLLLQALSSVVVTVNGYLVLLKNNPALCLEHTWQWSIHCVMHWPSLHPVSQVLLMANQSREDVLPLWWWVSMLRQWKSTCNGYNSKNTIEPYWHKKKRRHATCFSTQSLEIQKRKYTDNARILKYEILIYFSKLYYVYVYLLWI